MFRANRKRKTVNAYVTGAKMVGAAVFIIVIFMGWIFVFCRCQTVGQEIKSLETQNTDLLKQLKYEELKWARAKSPENLQRALNKHGLIMGLPDISQFVRVPRKDMLRDSVSSGGMAESREFAGIHAAGNSINE